MPRYSTVSNPAHRRIGTDMAREQQRTDDHIEEAFAAWRRERPGLDLTGMALVARLLRVAHRFDEAQGEFFAALGLKPGWLDVLGALRRAGEPYRLTPTRLSEEALISTAGTTNRLRPPGTGRGDGRPPPPPRPPRAAGGVPPPAA